MANKNLCWFTAMFAFVLVVYPQPHAFVVMRLCTWFSESGPKIEYFFFWLKQFNSEFGCTLTFWATKPGF